MLRLRKSDLSRVACLAALTMISMNPMLRADDGLRIRPVPVPGDLVVPEGHRPFLSARAFGTQNYICLPSPSGVLAWAPTGPQATLFDDDARQVLTHYLSPNPDETGRPARATWQHSRDSSAVWAVATRTSSDADYVAPGAIPWLRLDIVGAEPGPDAGDRMAETKYIQRVETLGGMAPADGCVTVGVRAFVPYAATYVFYEKARRHPRRD
jgi:hypothetical protein